MESSYPKPPTGGRVTSDYYRSPEHTTESLLAYVEFYTSELAELLLLPEEEFTRSNIAFLQCVLKEVRAELKRRKRLADTFANVANGPKWTDTAAARYEALLALAADLKREFPIDRFVSELLACKLEKAGHNRYRGACPLPSHTDKTPSFIIYADQGRAHCFGCGRGGDIFELTGHYFGISAFRDQVKKVAEGSARSYEEAAS